MNWMRQLLDRLNQTEPARVRAVWIALVAFLAAIGVVVSAEVDAAVSAGIIFLFTILPLLQGESTRRAVYAPATVNELMEGDKTAQVLAEGSEADLPDGDPEWDPDKTWDDEPVTLPDDVAPAVEPLPEAPREES